MLGTKLAHYEIIDLLGKGGMGEVYRARDTRLDREVALKVLPGEMADDPERLERFEREAKTVAGLSHPNIVTLHSVEEADGVRFLTMELVSGASLDQLIPEGGLPLERVFRLGAGVADALAAAHERGIVHRDLKPANVMVGDDGRPKVLDFGLAKLTEDEAAFDTAGTSRESATLSMPLTRDGAVMGTVPYMSPEQLRGGTIDHRSDVFSLGALLFEMTTGRRPFGGPSSADVSASILQTTPPLVTQLKPELPRHLARIVAHCLEKEPERRIQSALDVRNGLQALRDEVRLGETGSRDGSRVPMAEFPRAQSPAGRGSRAWLGLAAALVTVVAFVVILSGRDVEPGPTVGTPIVEEQPEALPAASVIDRRSIAVLPFVNRSADPD